MSRNDGLLTNESLHLGENRAAYPQDNVGPRHLNSAGSVPSSGGPTLNSTGHAVNSGGSPFNSGRPPLSNAGPVPPSHSSGLGPNNAATLLSSGRPQLGTGGSSINSTSPHISGGPPISNTGSPLNIGGPQMSSAGSPILTSGPQIGSAGPLQNSGRSPVPPLTSYRPPMTAGGPSVGSSGAPLTTSGPPANSAVPPINIGVPPINSGGPPISNTGPPISNAGQPLNSGRPLMNSGLPPVSNAGPPSNSTRPLLNTGGPPISNAGPLPNSTRPLLNAGVPPISNAGTMSNNTRPPLNISGPPISTAGQPFNSSRPPINSGMPPTSNAGLPLNSGRPPLNSGISPTINAGPLINSGMPPTSNTGLPLNSGRPPMNSGIPPTSNAGPLLNSGRPPLNSGMPPMNSGIPPMSNAGPLLNSGRPPLTSTGPPLSNSGPQLTGGSPLSSGPPLNKLDPMQPLSQQFQNVNLSGTAPPMGVQPGSMPLTNPQACSTTNRPLDMRHPNYTNAVPYNNQMNQNFNITKAGFNKIWGMDSVDLLQCRNILPPEKVAPPRIKLHQDLLDRVNCSPEIFRCTLTKIPDSNALLQKARLPLGILIHPFKDLNHLPVIQCSTIVRCRSCRTYINPFVYFVDSKRWKCNLCYKVNELPEEFQFDPATKSYGDPSRRPEIRTSTIEFIAPSEYMLRPPQPAVYLFIFDVSRLAVESGYLALVCNIVAEEMSRLPGDGRTQVGFLAVNSAIHFFSMQENVSRPHQMTMLDVDDVFLPCPENLIVNLKEREELIKDLLSQLPYMFKDSYDTNCALGAALQAAFKLMSPTGGRVTVFQLCLPNIGPGALQSREDPNTRAGKDVPYLNPATDFYKRLALDCSGQQIAVDLFLLNCQYSDLATLSGICKFSGGCIYYLPLFQASKLQHVEALEKMLRRYLTRKIGFEAVMRIRCTRGLSIHTFHGNFFVRSTDLLSLPNINPDAGFGMQVTIEENLSDMQNICFQAALLYTSSKGERRIRVHTLCLPISTNLSDIIYSADQQCIIGLLSKMAVDRSSQSSLSDAREALINAAVDALSAFKLLQSYPASGLQAPQNLKLLPMYIIALLKCKALRFGLSTRLDDRVYAMCQLKTLPLVQLIQMIYPDMYAVHDLVMKPINEIDGQLNPQPERLHLSAEKLDSRGAFLLDHGDQMLLYVGKNIHASFCYNVLGVSSFAAIPEEMYGLPELATAESERLRTFVATLQDEKPYYATFQVIRDDSHFRTQFTERLIEDRFENALSYYEFIQHMKTQIK
ncbi:protein transport protein Sec24A [Nasonia vitripennis]|uniref:Protein transport protein Sec24A n=1 Tax=Nasonia vitripennis TaxID=7425 RepID=A0A7M7GBE2_NASVI|nr:protein transport protein Sec24A [Nasonia vitripennis]